MICVQCIFKPGTYDDDFHSLEGQIDGYARSLPGFVRTAKYLSPDGDVVNAHLLLRRPEVRRPPRPVSRRIEKPGARCPPRTAPCHRHRTSPPGHPLSPDDIRQLLAHIDRTTVKGTRDASLILLGFASALRRSELAALTIADIESKPAGLLIDVRRSKGAPEARGQVVGVAQGRYAATDPIAALDAWLALRGTALGAAVHQPAIAAAKRPRTDGNLHGTGWDLAGHDDRRRLGLGYRCPQQACPRGRTGWSRFGRSLPATLT
jgi:integrase